MRVDAYIKSKKFILPLNHEELVKQVQEQILEKKTLKAETIGKMNPVIKIDRNDNLIVDGQKTNIFLLNFLLSVAEKKNIELTEQILCNNENIVTRLRELTELDLSTSFEKLETEINSFLQGKTSPPQEVPQKELSSILNTGVQFNMSWVKQAHSKIQEQANSRKELKD